MNTLLPVLNTLTPDVIWGLFPRLLGAVYFIAIASLYTQVLPFGGSKGLHPVKRQLEKIATDYPTWKRFFYFPTLLWINAEDWFIRTLVIAGSASALLAIYGGPFSGWCLLACWMVYLSLDIVMGLAYPWDSLLLESGFLALFLPPISSLPHIASLALPLPAVAFGYRLILFRLMFGFGKFKFNKSNLKERLYLKAFVINQPMPSPLGWYAFRLPKWIAVFEQGFLFVVEMILPFFIFFGGDFRILAALGIACLMIGIQLMGNFGFFNVLVISLCVTLLDSHASIFNQPLAGVLTPLSNLITHLVMVVLFVGGLVYFPFNSWCTQAWLYWPPLAYSKPKWLERLIAFYRTLAPFRIVHAYGVFPPTSSPPVKWIPLIEGSNDGLTWQAYHYRFIPSSPDSPPKFIAPYHPRLDHNIFYEALGTNLANFLESTFSWGNPYSFAHTSGLDAIVQRLLEGNSSVASLFGHNPFHDAPPKMIRINCYSLEPTTPAEQRRTGQWWHMKYVGTHFPVATLKSHPIEEAYPDPELFHWDQIIWKERAPRLNAMMTQAQAGRSSESILLQSGLTAQTLDSFWNDFVPTISRPDPKDWQGLPALVQDIRKRYSSDQIAQFEMIFARLSLILYARWKPHFFDQKAPKVELPTVFHVGLLAYYTIAKGRQIFEIALNDPTCAASLAKEMSPEAGLFYMGVFWYDVLVFHARKFRLVQQFNVMGYEPGLSGFVMLIPFVTEQFVDETQECLPTFIRRIHDGEWLTVPS